MKIKFIIISSILYSFMSVNSQSYLLLNNGEEIECNKANIKEDVVELKLENSEEKLNIPISNVQGYYSLEADAFYHLKPILDSKEENPYEFIN